ncbi:MAG: hypothetical protein BWX69_03255 [Planctomycetes bacterium ADurb.Bin069]|nr:MAG: hypothetical protein BWX69_03255 [Planctomycetes bacterium ADurb.Bin069]
MVQPREVEVGEPLARQVTDGQPAPLRQSRHRLPHDHLDHPTDLLLPEYRQQQFQEPVMRDAVEVVPDVQLARPRVPPHQLPRPRRRPVRALSNAARIAILREPHLQQGRDHAAQRVVRHPVPHRRATDRARLRVRQTELPVRPRTPRARQQIRPQRRQLLFPSRRERRHVPLGAAPLHHAPQRRRQILRRRDPLPKLSVRFHSVFERIERFDRIDSSDSMISLSVSSAPPPSAPSFSGAGAVTSGISPNTSAP